MTVRGPATAILERGDIYFAYRPRLDARTVHDLADVQRLYMIQSPHGKHAHRLIVIGAKRLPALSGRDDERRTWGFVETVAAGAEDVEDELDPRTYRTQTGGERHVPLARPAGEAVYALVRHDEHTDRGEESRDAFTAGRRTRRDAASAISEAVGRALRGRRFIPVDPPDFLDHDGAEVVLIGSGPGAAEDLGLELSPEQETAATAEIFRDMKLEPSLHPLAPLFEGKWA
jgi:hypothetical protein